MNDELDVPDRKDDGADKSSSPAIPPVRSGDAVISSSPAWHPDPDGRHQYRYWDGTAWSRWVSDNGTLEVDAATSSSAAIPSHQQVRPRLNVLALLSLIFGVLWIYWIGSVLAVVFGIVALTQLARAHGTQRGKPLAIIGLVLEGAALAFAVLGLIVLAIMSANGDLSN